MKTINEYIGESIFDIDDKTITSKTTIGKLNINICDDELFKSHHITEKDINEFLTEIICAGNLYDYIEKLSFSCRTWTQFKTTYERFELRVGVLRHGKDYYDIGDITNQDWDFLDNPNRDNTHQDIKFKYHLWRNTKKETGVYGVVADKIERGLYKVIDKKRNINPSVKKFIGWND